MDHRSLITREFVQQGALADVRLTDQRHPARTAARRRGLPHLGQRGEHPVEQVGHPPTVHRADRMRLTQAQRPQRRGVGFAFFAVDLVGGQEHRLAGSQQDTGRGLVGGGGTDTGVDHQDHRIRGAHGHRGLLGHQPLQALGIGLPSAGVLYDEPASGPQRVVADPVTRHAGNILHHRLAAAQDPVDQGGLADIGPADYRHHRRRSGLRDLRIV
ncbi:Uncharacterised protein [Mycobacterium tuberculosis]|nr:Uncharacterised protein [Mycobacterium tuberculosis]